MSYIFSFFKKNGLKFLIIILIISLFLFIYYYFYFNKVDETDDDYINKYTYFNNNSITNAFLKIIEANIYIYFLFFLVITSFAILPYTATLGLYGIYVSALIPLFLFSYIFLMYSIFIRYYGITTNIILGNWFITSNNYEVVFEIKIDYLSASFAALTSNIGFFSVVYLFSYFRGEPHIPRLLLLIQFFIISMMLFIFASNLIVLFLGWELIGLTSFLLINFWTPKASVLKSSFKALYFNKWSDTFLMLFIFLCYIQFGTLDIELINSQLWMISKENFKYLNYTWYTKNNSIDLVPTKTDNTEGSTIFNIPFFLFLFLILGSSIKSAQFLCHLWLPDSMEAPVPASALIHSATLVSAGIYLILRFTDLLHLLVTFNQYLILWGAITAIYGGISACGQNDLKKILAYSTISHCGNMFLLASAGFADLTIVYLYVHGYFKALSFLCVGNIIRFYKNTQDLRKMGMSVYYLPLDSLALFISLINLGGLPLTLGYYIKHYVLSFLLVDTYIHIIISLALIGTSITGFIYTLKIIYHVFFDFKKGSINVYTVKETTDVISKFNSSTSYLITYLFIGAFITAYLLCFYLIALEHPEIIDSGQQFDGAAILKKSKEPKYGLGIGRLICEKYWGLPLLIIFIIIDYYCHATWRYISSEKNGILVLYFILWSLMLFPLHIQLESMIGSLFPFLKW